jgi:hypothetical protein
VSVINAVPLLAGAGGDYQISRSVRLRSSATAYFNRTPASAGNTTKCTFSFWIKRGTLSTAQQIYHVAGTSGNNSRFFLAFNTTDTFSIVGYNSAGTLVIELVTTQVFRDPSAWYHVVISIDTTQASSSNRAILYINGVQVSSFGTSTIPAQNTALGFTNNTASLVGANQGATNYFDGYLTEINFIDGQALTPSSFGENDSITGVWKPKKYTGTYGTNGFYLNFSDNSNNTATTIGKDYSGNGNNWTPNNISVTAGATYDSMLDVPTLYADGGNGRGNYCTLNPTVPQTNNTQTISAGNLQIASAASAVNQSGSAIGTIGVSSGKWYWECSLVSDTTAQNITGFGITNAIVQTGFNNNSTGNQYFLFANGTLQTLGSQIASWTSSFSAGDIIGIALNVGAGTLAFYKNGTLLNTYSSITANITYWPWYAQNTNASGVVTSWFNFGQRPFAYTPPTGFKALNTQNLPDSTIKNGASYMAATTYTGTGTTKTISNDVNGVSFQPDLVWTKSRNNVTDHFLLDSVRGGSAVLFSDLTNAEITGTNYISGFLSGGFSTNSASNGINASGYTYAAWQWKAGGAAVTNNAGSISSQVSANPTAGFSVVTYTGNGTAGATVGHGLGVVPSMVIVKQRNGARDWFVKHKNLSANNNVQLSTTVAQFNASTAVAGGGIADLSSSTTISFLTGTGAVGAYLDNVCGGGGTYAAYCFAEVAGFSKFGSYTGNASTDGPFVYCGFRPRWILIKNASAATFNWFVWDTSRDTYNAAGNVLLPNDSSAEITNRPIDILSNGFKIRATDTHTNGSGNTMIFAAFAENPFKNSLAR